MIVVIWSKHHPSMDKLEFACFFARLQKTLNVHIDSDIVSIIYTEYIRTYFDKYTLFQLISMLDAKEIWIGTILSKKAIINRIETNKLDVQCGLDRYSPQSRSDWNVYNMKYIDYTNSPYPRNVDENLICITNSGTRTEIMNGDIFKINKQEYKVFRITDDMHITVKIGNKETNMLISEFMEILDTQDVTIELNKFRHKICKMDAKYYNRISQ